jgi:dTDP-4-dehydrorhamnose 3,5-epimerase
LKLSARRLAGVFDVATDAFEDERGFIARAFDADLFQAQGIAVRWIQHNASYTTKRATLRGLHVQLAPFSETKLIWPMAGRMCWVTVDLRQDSPSFGRWEATTLDARVQKGLFVHAGFGHGCVSLSDEVALSILSDNRYSHAHGVGIRWDDPELAIDWPLEGRKPLVSAAHAAYPSFREFKAKVGGIKSVAAGGLR